MTSARPWAELQLDKHDDIGMFSHLRRHIAGQAELDLFG
ncbi:hypothetical protein SGRIM119S_03065 [Streptomyces griseorubiginosus]